MRGICKTAGKLVDFPCASRACPLYADCLIEYERESLRIPTNEERIRGMLREELADFIIKYRDDMDDYETPTGECFELRADAIEATMKWLKEPSEISPKLVSVKDVLNALDEVFDETSPEDGAAQIALLKCRGRIRKLAEEGK